MKPWGEPLQSRGKGKRGKAAPVTDVKAVDMGDVPKRRGNKKRTAPPAVYTDTFRFLLTPEMKEWLLAKGGADYLRRLVQEDIDRWEDEADSQLAAYKRKRQDTAERLDAERNAELAEWNRKHGKSGGSQGIQ